MLAKAQNIYDVVDCQCEDVPATVETLSFLFISSDVLWSRLRGGVKHPYLLVTVYGLCSVSVLTPALMTFIFICAVKLHVMVVFPNILFKFAMS